MAAFLCILPSCEAGHLTLSYRSLEGMGVTLEQVTACKIERPEPGIARSSGLEALINSIFGFLLLVKRLLGG